MILHNLFGRFFMLKFSPVLTPLCKAFLEITLGGRPSDRPDRSHLDPIAKALGFDDVSDILFPDLMQSRPSSPCIHGELHRGTARLFAPDMMSPLAPNIYLYEPDADPIPSPLYVLTTNSVGTYVTTGEKDTYTGTRQFALQSARDLVDGDLD